MDGMDRQWQVSGDGGFQVKPKLQSNSPKDKRRQRLRDGTCARGTGQGPQTGSSSEAQEGLTFNIPSEGLQFSDPNGSDDNQIPATSTPTTSKKGTQKKAVAHFPIRTLHSSPVPRYRLQKSPLTETEPDSTDSADNTQQKRDTKLSPTKSQEKNFSVRLNLPPQPASVKLAYLPQNYGQQRHGHFPSLPPSTDQSFDSDPAPHSPRKRRRGNQGGETSHNQSGAIFTPDPAINQILLDTLKALSQNITDNTSALKTLTKAASRPHTPQPQVKQDPEVALDVRDDRVQVQLRVAFLRIIDVDTKNQNYAAEVFIQARWEDPKLHGLSQQELDVINLNQYWDPQVIITNIDGNPAEDSTWYAAKQRELGSHHPVIFYRRRLRALFNEILELKDFPVDTQELTVQIASERTAEELEFIEDRNTPSSVNLDNFKDAQEWELFEHVEVVENVKAKEMMNARFKSPKLDFQCHVARKPGFFMWNVLFVMFLITNLTFTTFTIDPGKPNRLSVTFTLLLTSVAFKFVVAGTLPTISYLTYLDIYVLSGMVFMCIHAVLMSIMAYLAQNEDRELTELVDWVVMVSMASMTILFHIIYISFLYLRFAKNKRRMRRKEAFYREKKRLLSHRSPERQSSTGRFERY